MFDSGLQAERTRLSWSRTALSFAAVGALMLHNAMMTGGRLNSLPGFVTLCCAASTYLIGVGRYHATTRKVPRGISTTSTGTVRTVTALAVLTVVLTLVLITV